MSDAPGNKSYLIKTGDAGLNAAINEFLAGLLKDDKASAILAPQKVSSGDMVFPAMISRPEKMDADPLAPVLPVSTARMVSELTMDGAPSTPVLAVMRNCQIRALAELVKLNQADLNNVIILGVDCPGTFDVKTYRELRKEKSGEVLSRSLLNGEEQLTERMRSSCRTCTEPFPKICDLRLEILGAPEKGVILKTITEKGESILKDRSLEQYENESNRDKAVQEFVKKRNAANEKFLEETSEIRGIEKVLEFYEPCINCQNCRRVCPVCYCRECFFSSDELRQSADDMVGRSRARGAFKMPMDTLLFHTGRMNHMILSCVECGLCEQACPVDIPLMDIIKRAAVNAQAEFDYRAGRSLEEDMPLKVFREEEFTDVGEK